MPEHRRLPDVIDMSRSVVHVLMSPEDCKFLLGCLNFFDALMARDQAYRWSLVQAGIVAPLRERLEKAQEYFPPKEADAWMEWLWREFCKDEYGTDAAPEPTQETIATNPLPSTREQSPRAYRKRKTVECPKCGKRVKNLGVHNSHKHPELTEKGLPPSSPSPSEEVE